MQTFVAGKVTMSLNEKNNIKLSIDKVGVSYLGKVKLEGIFAEDHHGDTLFIADELRSSILSLPAIVGGNPDLGKTYLDGLEFKMKKYAGEEKDNFSLFLDKLRKNPSEESSGFTMDVSSIQVENGHYSYTDESLDYQHAVYLDSVALYTSDFKINGDQISTTINSLSGYEKRGIKINNLSTHFKYAPEAMSLDNLSLQTPQSSLNGKIFLNTETGFSDFENTVEITANFEESSLSSTDLQPFHDGFGDRQVVLFNTNLQGTLNNFVLDNFKLRGLDRSRIDGNFQIEGVFSDAGENLKITGDFSEFTSNYYDLINLLPGDLKGKLPEKLRDFGNIKLNGTSVLTKNSLEARLAATSQLGSADIDVSIDNITSVSASSYQGNLTVRDFNVGRLLENETIGKTSFDIEIDGSGFDQENLSTRLEGNVSKIEYKGYSYSNIRVIGNLRQPVFNGYLVANDPNLKMEFNGLADLSQETNIYDFEAAVGYADLNAINLISKDSVSIFKGDVIMNMRGTSIDDAAGEIMLLNTSYQNQNDFYYFDDFSIVSSFEGEVRSIQINSPDVINGEVTGIFKLSEIAALFQNSLGSIYTNYEPETITDNQYMEFDFEIYNKIVEVFHSEITLAPDTEIRGRVESDESEFKLNFHSPQIDAFGNYIENLELRVDNTNPIYNTYFDADSVATDFYKFSEFSFINVTQRDTLYIRSEFRGGKKNDDVFNLNLFHTINEDNQSVIGFQRSDIQFRNNIWFLNEERNKSNKIVFDNNFRNISIDSIIMNHKDEEIRLSGIMRDSTYKNFSMEFDNVDVGKITPHIDSLELGGLLNGKLDLLQENGAYYPNTSMKIDSLKVNGDLMGNLEIDVAGNEDLTNYAINATLQEKRYESLNAVGGINVSGEQPSIDLNVDLNRLKLSAFSPLGGEAFTNVRGLASGEARISGNYKNPEFSGIINLEEAGLLIPYLNVDLDFEDDAKVDLSEQQFIFDDIGIVDTKYKTRGILNGTISHRNFIDWTLDLNIDTDRLLVLDTEAQEESLYYGTAFISGDANINGPTNQLSIEVTATTEKGTVFKIPLSDTESAGDNSYIHFISPEEKAALLAGEEIEEPEVSGIELLFDLDVTDDAEVEVVVDQTSGSTLRGRGAGNLLLEINTNGKFNMWGDFVVYEGVYNFKYAGLVQKVFRVESGGSINWDGNPTRAQLDVSAIYELNANPAVLLENPSVNRKIPVEVIIDLQGEVSQPEISFEIDFPNASSVVRSELEYRMDDRASRELQALFLVTQGSFYSEFGLRETAITGTLAERASSIINDIFADEDGQFQVGVNYVQGDRTPDQQTVDRFGLTLSTQISDRVLIDGEVGVPIGGVTESVIVGDLEISFLLNEDGSLRANVFNRENNIQFIGEEIGFTQGVGLSYSVDFDTFKEFIQKIVNAEAIRQKEEQEAEAEMKNSAKSIAPDYISFPEETEN